MSHLGWWGVGLFVAGCIAEGAYLGLQQRFGPNVREGYRAYKRECAYWKERGY